MTAIQILAYECERCGGMSHASTEFAADKPQGYYVNLRRVGAGKDHYITDELFLCSKECLVDYMQYGISASTTAFRPIGEKA